jgi:hypothetical protein
VLGFILAALSLGSVSPGLEHIIVVHQGPLREVRGVVVDPQQSPISEVRVELYDHPEVWLDPKLRTMEDRARLQHKLRKTVTRDRGEFKFNRVKPGRYELRLTRDGFNVTSIILTVTKSHQDASADHLTVEMTLGT